jgi:type 1 fimbria pilin
MEREMAKQALSFLILIMMAWSVSPDAIAGCSFNPTITHPMAQTVKLTMPLSGINAISVPSGTPVGQEIYRQYINISQGSSPFSIKCDSPGRFYYDYNYKNPGHLTPSVIDNQVYETGWPGIGVKFYVNGGGGDFPYSHSASNNTSRSIWEFNLIWSAQSYLVLVKTAETITPGVFPGNIIPTTTYSYGQQNDTVPIYEIQISGILNITTPTCNISPSSGSMVVQMGKYKTNSFTGVNTGSPWKNASITLNCPNTFYGNTGVNGVTNKTAGTFNGAATTVGSLANNMWELTLTPADGIIGNATNGTIKLADSDSPMTAVNVGIQLSKTASTSSIINLSSPVTGTFPNTGTSNVAIPLYARYIQTGTPVTAGKARGKLIYTVSYK